MLKLKSLSIIIMLLMSLLIFIVPVSAADYNVYSGDTIQDAIDAASYGDTVYVHAGTYTENITLKDGVSLIGDDSSTTIIDGGGSGRVVTADGVTCTISGFTISNGDLGSTDDGAGMLIDNSSSINIEDCDIRDNTARYGGGIYIDNNSSATIEGCEFINNTAGYGGGIYMETPSSSISVDECLFDSNLVLDDGYGGAMYLDISAITETTTISDSTIINNSAGTSGGGIYIAGDSSSNLSIEYCSFYNNSVYYDGNIPTGGAICLDSLPTTIINCDFYKNEAEDTSVEGRGGAIYLYQVPSSYIYNSTFYDNKCGQEGYGIYAWNSTSEIKNCILWDSPDHEIYLSGSTVDIFFSDIDDANYNGINNNIKSDPSFVDPDNGDLHIDSDSPCIDAGTNIPEVTDDFDYDERPQGTAYDIGADEYFVSDADLSIVKTVSSPWVFAGRYAYFTITVTNNGPGDATGVEVADVMPAGLIFDYSISSKGMYNGTTWTIGNLADDAQATLQIFVKTNLRGEFINTATVSGNEDDSVSGNDEDQAKIYVHNPRFISFISLALMNQHYTETLYDNILLCLPEVVSPEVQELLDEVQDHMANAASLTNPIYSNGELIKAIKIMKQIKGIIGV